MHVENTITIERPIEEVFEYVSTPENDPTWVSASIKNQRTSPGPMRVGMTIEEDVKIFGRTSRVAPDSRTLWNMRCAVFTTRR